LQTLLLNQFTMANKIAAMFNIEVVKQAIAKCPKGEVVILMGHWSINGPKYDGPDEDPEAADWDWTDFEEMLDVTLMVSDYDDLIADPHGIYNS
jgi:hypothetical protein